MRANTGIACATTDASGEYSVLALPSGEYTVYFSHGSRNYVDEYYDDAPASSGSQAVPVTLGESTARIDAALEVGGEISGRVTSADTGNPVSGIAVTASQSGGTYYSGYSTTDSDGEYTLIGLPGGQYTVEFFSYSGAYGTQFYDGRVSGESADPVAVAQGSLTSGVDAELHEPPPVQISPPTISGTSQEGETLSEGHGSWTNSPTVYAYQWLRCDESGFGCSPISGAESQTYGLTEADVGHTLKVEEVASNAGGPSSPAVSSPTPVVLPLPPVNVVSPKVSGTAQQGETLTESHGSWTHEPTSYTYAWLRCEADGEGCSPISGAQAAEYVPVAADVGHALRVRETAINAGGPGDPADSGPTAVVVPPVPVNVSAPSISGTARQGETLTESHDSWTNEPTSYEYAWLRCDEAGEGCSPVSGAHASEYALVAADVGHTLRVSETAINAGGASEPKSSAATAVVAPAPPVNTSPPSISGTAQQGETLTESHGSWTHEPTSYTYAWLRCEADGEGCSPISGAQAAEYVPVAADVGHALRVRETAINAGGPGDPADSGPTAVVVPPVPVNVSAPSISGTARQGETLTESHDSWTNEPTSYEYAWLRCDEAGEGCSPVSGAHASEYALVAADVGHTLRVSETAINAGGASEPKSSAATAVVAPAPPVNTAPPAIVGEAQNGLILTESQGSWTNEPTSYEYQWLRCSSTATECTAIAGAVDPTYKLTVADVGHRLKVEEIAVSVNGRGAPATSGASHVVTLIPLTANAGDDIATTEGAAVHFDATGSTPAREIEHYKWEFGDGGEASGASTTHAYASPGTYTVTLTVSRGSDHASASATVAVAPVPGHEAVIEVTDQSAIPLQGATVLYVGPLNKRIEATTNSEGKALLAGLPAGRDAVYAYGSGYQPAVGHVTVGSDGSGEATIALEGGAIGSSTLKAHEMTLAEIEAAGIDVSDPANQNVYEFEVRLAFLPEPEEYATLHCYINENGEFVGSCGGGGAGGGGGGGWGGWGAGGGGGGGGPGCSPHRCVGGGLVAEPSIVDGHPIIQWLILRGKATVLKQFFEVTQVVQNLSSEPFRFGPGTATLDIPPGMSLAPTATPQAATQSVPEISGEGSAETDWIVRGDQAGLYPLSANYHSQLEPFEAPFDLEAQLATPLHVWGAEALELHVEAEQGALAEGRPYRVQVKVSNKANVPISNVGVEIFSDVHAQFIFQPGQKFSESIAELGPGETISAPMDILVPDAPSEYPFNPNLSSIHFVGEEIHPGEGVSTLASAPIYSLVASDESASHRVRLTWESDPDAEGYEVYSTPTLDTPFPDSPEQVMEVSGDTAVTRLPAGTTEAFAPYDSDHPDEYYAVTSIVSGTPTLDHLVALASTGSGADDWGYCAKADAATGLGIGTAEGTVCLIRSGDGSGAYLLTHTAADFTLPSDLTHLKSAFESLAHSCALAGSASLGAIAFEGPAGEDPGVHDFATVNGSVGVSIPLTDFGGGVEGALMQSRDQSTFGLYYAYDASVGVGCLHLPISVAASTEADYRFESHNLTEGEKDQVLSILSGLRSTFTGGCLGILHPERIVPNCSLAAIPRIGKPAIDLVRHAFPSLYLSASEATKPPDPPQGISDSDWQRGSSDQNTGFTTVSSGGLSATAKGIGAIGIGSYDAEPQGIPALRVGSSYFDAKVSKDSIFGAVIITDCNIGGSSSVQWWNSGAGEWQDVSAAVFSSGSPRCVEITIGPDTSPSLSQLTGTVFATAPPTPACAASPAIAMQPKSETVTTPAEATFHVEEGSVPSDCSPASIQWQQSTDDGSSWNAVSGANFAGTASTTLRINPTAVGESGHLFRAVLANAHGETDSESASLTVDSPPADTSPPTTSGPSESGQTPACSQGSCAGSAEGGGSTPPGRRQEGGSAIFSRIGLVLNGKVNFAVSCPGSVPCRGVAKLLLETTKPHAKRHHKRAQSSGRPRRKRGRPSILGRGRFRIPAGKRGTIRIKLTSAGTALLRRAGKHGLRVKLRGTGLRPSSVVLKPKSRNGKRAHRHHRWF